MKLPDSAYKSEPCPGCGRIKVRYGKRYCSGCESRMRRGSTFTSLRKRDYGDNNQPLMREEPKLPEVDNVLLEGIRTFFRRGRGKRGAAPVTVLELADKFECAPKRIKEAVEALRRQGIMLDLSDGVVSSDNTLPATHDVERIDISKFKGRRIRFGLTADNHLCSKYARPEVLNALFDIWAEQGITEVYQCGNMIDGEAKFNKHDLLVPPGVESQVSYFIKNWPSRPGITTRFVCGHDHEGWYTKDFGLDIGRKIQFDAEAAGRTDLDYLGYMEHDIIFHAPNGDCRMRVVHAGGGSSYAVSYSVQKIVESYQGGEKPNILLVGHYHKAEYSYPREVHVVQAGCTQDQTPFMRQHKLQAMLGGWTISFTIDENGICHDFLPQFHAFYDRDFYHKWEYLWK